MSDRQEKGLHLLYKNIGETPLECINRFKKENSEYSNLPMTYAGRLDPMAEGLLIVLSGEALNDKDKYLGLNKKYIFEILWGFSTDTFDILGKVENIENTVPKESELREILQKSIGKFEQKYPAYSSQPVSGKPLFQWAREGRLGEIEIPKHHVEIFSKSFLGRREISKDDLVKDILRKISLVNGDFRQREIIGKWRDSLSANNPNFVIDKVEVLVSGGFYVRQFVRDLGKELQNPSVTYSIQRTQIGQFHL